MFARDLNNIVYKNRVIYINDCGKESSGVLIEASPKGEHVLISMYACIDDRVVSKISHFAVCDNAHVKVLT